MARVLGLQPARVPHPVLGLWHQPVLGLGDQPGSQVLALLTLEGGLGGVGCGMIA